MPYDVIVIGAGLAGLMGGITLAEAGYRVLLLAKGQGTTHWAAGTIDLADGERPLETIDRHISAAPDHPYARAGADALNSALARFRALAAAAGYAFVGSLDHNVLLPTAVGALRPTALLPATMAAGDARLPGPALVAGFRELRDFYPAIIAANLQAQGIAARAVYLELPPVARKLDFTPVVFARLFDDPAFRAHVGRQLRAQRGDARRIALPAILGLQHATQVVAELQAMSGALIFEIPTLPPSAPGIRLYELLAAAFRRAGGRMQIGGWVSAHEATDRTLHAVYTEAAARKQRHTARAFLLATGGIAGGGLRTDHAGTIVETALGLPVAVPREAATWLEQRFLAERGHPIFRAGIATDAHLRPVDAIDQRVFDNVAVAGAALAGADLLRERCYEGVALATGWRAAQTLRAYLEAGAPRPDDRLPASAAEPSSVIGSV